MSNYSNKLWQWLNWRAFSLLFVMTGNVTLAQEVYFPASDAGWERVDPASVGWDAAGLSAALEVAGSRDSSGVVILHNGRIMAERYWDIPSPPQRYLNNVAGKDSAGRAIEDVASAQKSIVAVLTGIAQEKGLLDIDAPVSQYLGKGWTQTTEQQEEKISVRHLLAMNSGLATDMTFAAEAGSVWLYNTPAYHYVMRIIETVAGSDRETLTRKWISAPLGMTNSSWAARPWADPSIGVGFVTTARDLARFGLMIQAGGRWQDTPIIGDKAFLQTMLTPSQSLNPAYGHLWWLNGQEFSLTSGADARRIEGKLIPAAPDDLVAMQGAMNRKLYLVPSLNLVITRLGADGNDGASSFNTAFWEALMQARL